MTRQPEDIKIVLAYVRQEDQAQALELARDAEEDETLRIDEVGEIHHFMETPGRRFHVHRTHSGVIVQAVYDDH